MSDTATKQNPAMTALVFGGKAAAAALGGFVATKTIPPLFWFGLRKINPKIQIPLRNHTPTHRTIGKTVLTAGIITRNPILIGIGGGMYISNVDNAVLRKRKWLTAKEEHPDALNMIRYTIPDFFPWQVQYEMLGDILTEIVTKPTWNETQRKFIPPGREHPAVIDQARQIVRDNNLDGHDKIAVLRAIQAWVQDNINYVYDPRWLDVFAHPYITLKKRVEDCDGHALLVVSLGEALGIPMAFVLIGQRRKDHYNHILSAGIVDRKLVPIETIPIQGNKAPFGWMPTHLHKKVILMP